MTIQIKRTKVGTAPSSLADGQLFIDQLNGVMKWADSTGAIQATPLKTAVANGLASLDSGGKIPTAQLPAAIVGALQYQGTWSAAANTPALTSGIGTKGNFYKVSAAGTTAIDGNAVWLAGDLIVFDGLAWDRIDGGVAGVDSTDLADSTALGRSLIVAASIAAAQSALGLSPKGFFFKADATTPTFSVTGAGTISVKAGTIAECAGVLTTYASATAVTMPSLSAGTDYAIYQCSDGTIRADASFTAPTGYTTTNSRQIGGFHYAPGGNAAAMAGGNTTPAINPYSVWDLKFRPRCIDPRGMALVAGRFWADIYLTNTATDANGSSRYGLAICSGGVPPKIPAAFGGNGSTAYGQFNMWDATEVLASVGKRLLTTKEFQIAAYGTTEETSLSADPVTTGLQAGTYTSKWGLFQAAGCYWAMGRELGGPYPSASWTQSTGNRGQFVDMPNAVFLGGSFGNGSSSGSRASLWNYAASNSAVDIGARGCCDHLISV
jgi:hypothetical protein